MLLQDHGFETVTAEDGADATEKIRGLSPVLVTLDVSMPEKSGVRFYRELRESAEHREIPVIIVTGVDRAFENFISTRGAVPPPDGYVPKPIDRDKLLEAVKRLTGI
jgi:CheY-like chemotaxis protein